MNKNEFIGNIHALWLEISAYRDQAADECDKWYYEGQLAALDIIEDALEHDDNK